jgi:hypothetical protein
LFTVAHYVTMRTRLNVQFTLHREHGLFALERPFGIVFQREVMDVYYGEVTEYISGLSVVGKQRF